MSVRAERSAPVASERITTSAPGVALPSGIRTTPVNDDEVVWAFVGCRALVDRQLVRAIVLDRNGEIVRVIGQKGEGPGELRGAYRAFQISDGTVGITGGAPALTLQMGGTGAITTWAADGSIGSNWYAAGDPGGMPTTSVRELRQSGDRILTATYSMSFGSAGMVDVQELSFYVPSEDMRQIVRRFEISRDPAAPIKETSIFEPLAYGRCDINSAGAVVYAPERDAWVVVIDKIDGSGVVWRRSTHHVERSAADMQKAQSALGLSDQAGVSRYYPAIGRLRWRPNGNLWVETPVAEHSKGILARFDEYLPSGKPLQVVEIASPTGIAGGELFVLENGEFVLLVGFGDSSHNADDLGARPQVLLLEIDGT